MATQPAETTSANPVAVIRQNLTAMEPEFKAALPPHITVERFKRVALTAIQNTPDLATKADRRSLFGAFVKLAQDGLLPDGREAAVVMFGNKAQAMPMIGGILKRIRQSGEVARVSAQVVYMNDQFTVSYGFDEDVQHVPPPLNKPRGEPIGAYATAVLKDGSKLLEVMSLEEIEKVRAVSRASRNGPWVAWWSEMARKTVMRRLSKRLPMSTDLEDELFSRDETMRARIEPEQQTIDVEPAAPVGRLDALEHQIGGAREEVDEVTGEVIEEQADAIEAEIVEEQSTDGPAVESTPPQGQSDEAPAWQAKFDAIMAEINDPANNAVMDVQRVLTKNTNDIAAMPDEQQVQIEIAADKRRNAIRAEQARAKEAVE